MMRHNVRPFAPLLALRRLFLGHRQATVATEDELADFLAAQTAYVSQRTVLEYCRARTGLNWDKLLQEEPFVQSFEVCRWDAYATLLPEIAELVLIRLRRQGMLAPQAYLPGLIEAARAALLRHPVPAHRSSWAEAAAEIERHLALILLAEPRPVHLMGFKASDVIFDILPIHADLRREDREMFRNSLRFALCRAFEETTRRLDVPALEASLQDAGGKPGAEPAP
jgi:hypothetical protein